MAKNITLSGTNYTDVSNVNLPLTDGGYATFADADEISAARFASGEITYGADFKLTFEHGLNTKKDLAFMWYAVNGNLADKTYRINYNSGIIVRTNDFIPVFTCTINGTDYTNDPKSNVATAMGQSNVTKQEALVYSFVENESDVDVKQEMWVDDNKIVLRPGNVGNGTGELKVRWFVQELNNSGLF